MTEINCIVSAERCAGVQHTIALSPRRLHHGMRAADDDLSEAMAHLSSPISTEQFPPIDQRKLKHPGTYGVAGRCSRGPCPQEHRKLNSLCFFLKLSRRRRFPRRPTRSRKQRARGRRHPETGLGVSGRDATWGRGAMLFVALLPPPGPGPGLGFGRCVAGRGTLPRVRGCGRADRGAGTVTLRSHAGSRTGIDNTRHACEIIATVGL